MKVIKLFICIITIFFSTAVSAEFYKYIDENGNISFTDDFNKVPKEQRKGLKGYEESKSDSDTDTLEKKLVKEIKGQNDNKNQKSLGKIHDRLNNTRLQLIKEHEEIQKKRKQVREDRKNAETPEDVLKVSERIKSLNKQQEELKNKYEKFETERKEYMEKLEEMEDK